MGQSVLTMHGHNNRDGFFVDAKLTSAAAATMHNDPAFNAMIDGNAYATPLYVDAGAVPMLNAGKATLFVATENNNVYALDAATGMQVWMTPLGGNSNGPYCGDPGPVQPSGVSGTPAIDIATNQIVMASAQGGGGGTSDYVVFALDLVTGMTKWQVGLSGINGFDPNPHLQRPAALIVNGFAYFAFGGKIGDCGAYHGYVFAVPLDGNKANVKSWRPMDDKSGIWGPGGPASDGNAVYVTTGNGTAPGSWAGSEGVIRLGFDLSFTNNAMDYYAVGGYAGLDQGDADLGGSGIMVIDTPMGKKLLLALGKDGSAYLIDRTNMGGVGGTLVDTQTVAGGPISNAPAWANSGGATYVVSNMSWVQGGVCAMNSGSLFALKIDPATNKMSEIWCADPHGHSSPIITAIDANGTNPIAWVGGGNDSAGGGGAGDDKLHAFDLITGNEIMNQAMVPGMAVLSSSLIAANGHIYAAGNQGKVYSVMP